LIATYDGTTHARIRHRHAYQRALGFLISGALAAPLAGYLLRRLLTRVVLILVGIVITGLSLVSLVGLFMR
jgi:uncharacterized membrane protein (Fun14 family)